MIGTRINDRYRIDSELGRGGMSTVYKGYDAVLERDVALKMVSGSGLCEEGRNRLLKEAKAIAHVCHPNIITVYDVGEYQESPYIVMEYIEGYNLYQQPPREINIIVTIMQQICAALVHAHKNDFIHRDLKPENVILTADGTAKLMDFGLARPISSRLSNEGLIQGTVFYLAPEQAQGQAVDQRSDLYSLGVMLYELITGELPFTADNPLGVISQHIHAPVVPPRAKNDQIPPALEGLTLQLMQKNPADRPSSAKEVLERLALPEMLNIDAFLVEEISLLDRIVRGRLVGRERELYQARQTWQQTISRQGQLLLICGEPGIGKSRLMHEIVTQAEVSGGQAYIGESQAEGNAPYTPFAQIIRRALRTHQNNELELSNLLLAELISIAPALQVDFPEIMPNPSLEPESERLRLFESVFRFVDRLCQKKPLLMVLEDIQWADSGTLSLLQFLAQRCQDNPVMLLVTFREVKLVEHLPFHKYLLGLNRKNMGSRLKLERLDINRTREMLAGIFAEEITPEFLEGIYAQTEGNPFFIEEVCKALIESKQLYFDGERWQRPPDMADMQIPQSIRVTVLSRVSKLRKSAQEVLLYAALIGHEFDFSLLLNVSGIDEDILIDSLEAALTAQLIEEIKDSDGECFSFSHALIPNTLIENISDIRQTRLHRKLAEVMEILTPENYQRLAYHWGKGGNLEKRLDYTIKAAERAKKTYANEDAIRLYSEVLDLLPEEDERFFNLLKTRGELFDFVADRESQHADIETMLRLAEEQNNQENQVDALLAMVELYLHIDLPKALEPAERAQKISRKLGDLPRQARSAHLIGRYYADCIDHNRALPHMKEAIQIARKARLKHELVDYLHYRSKSEFNLGMRDVSMASAQEANSLSNELNDKRIQTIGTIDMARAHLAAKNYEAGLPVIQTALSLAREIGDLGQELQALNTFAMILTGLDRLEEAVEVYLEMINNFDLFHFAQTLAAVNNIDYCYTWLGEHEKFHHLIRDLLEKANRAGSDLLVTRLTGYFANSCFRLCKYQEALKRLEIGLPFVENLGNQVYLVTYPMNLGLFSALVGDYDSAYRYLQSAQANSEKLEESLIKTTLLVISALVALLDGNASVLPTGIEQAEKGIAMFQQIGYDTFWEYFIILAGLHLACKHDVEAKAALEMALKAFNIEPYPDLILPEMLFSIASRVYRANNQPEEADEYLRKAYERVMLVAGKIQDDDLRRSYLENVKDNREILKEAKARGMVMGD